jgi:hypothetical protein
MVSSLVHDWPDVKINSKSNGNWNEGRNGRPNQKGNRIIVSSIGGQFNKQWMDKKKGFYCMNVNLVV